MLTQEIIDECARLEKEIGQVPVRLLVGKNVMDQIVRESRTLNTFGPLMMLNGTPLFTSPDIAHDEWAAVYRSKSASKPGTH